MPDDDLDVENQPPEGDAKPPSDNQENIKVLREQAKAAKDAEARAAAAERELAFAKAGVPLDDKRAPLFLKGYDGPAEAEAIKAAWDEHFGSAPSAPATSPEEQAAHGRMADAAAGASAPPPADLSAQMRDAVAKGEIRDANDVATWLSARGQPTSWEGPQSQPAPWPGLR